MPQRPHHPAGRNQSAHEKSEAVQAIVELVARVFTLSDAENSGCKDRENQSGVEVREGQNFFSLYA